MQTSENMLDKIINHYVDSLKKDGNSIPDTERKRISEAVKDKVLREAYIPLRNTIINKAHKEASEEKQKILKKFKITLIIETLFIAFLVGVIVNQVTNLIPAHWYIGIPIIVISLLTCVLMVILTMGKE